MASRWLNTYRCLLILLASSAIGCTAIDKHVPLPSTFHTDVSKERRIRKQSIVESFEAKRNLAQVLAARRRLEQGDAQGARDEALAVLQRDPDCAEAQELLAEIENPAQYQPVRTAADNGPLREAGIPPTPAADQFNHPLRVNSSAALLQVAAQAIEAGDYERAGEQLVTFVGDTRRSEPELQQAASLALQTDQFPLAVQLAGVGLQRFPQSAGLYRIRGAAEYRLGDFVAAQTSMRQALSLDNSHPLSYFLLGLTSERLGDSSGAAYFFQQAATIDPRYASR